MNSEENPSWQYKPGQDPETAEPSPAANSASPAAAAQNYSWTGAEYIEHQQSAGWYVMILLGLIVITVGIYFMTKDYFAVGATIAAAVIAVVYAHRKPRQVNYELTSKSLGIGQKKYAYNMFKSFSIFREGELSSLNFTPIKRLMPPISIYFAPQDEQKIADLVGKHIPYEEHKVDAVDRLVRSLHL